MNIIHKPFINEKLFYTKHESGMDVYIIPKHGYAQYFGVIAFYYGSNDSEFVIRSSNKSITVPDGIAHFLEHKMFDKKDGNILDEYGVLGSSPNAYTNPTTTAYLFTSTGNVKENLELLFKNVHNPYFTDESVEKEKGIIGQEINMYQDNPSWRVYFNLLDCLYVKHPAKKEIAGTIESISGINKELLYDCYNTFYQPSNSVFLMVGDIDTSEILSLVDDNIRKYGHKKGERPVKVFPHEPPKLNKTFIEQKLAIAQPLFAIGFKDTDVGYNGSLLLEKELLTSIILDMAFGRSSWLFRELYDNGLINNTFGSEFMGEKDYGYSLISGESKEPMRVSDAVKDYIKSEGTAHLSEEKFERTKKKFIGQFLASFNSVEYIGSNFISYHMRGINVLDYLDVIKGIQYKDIKKRFAEHISEKNMAMSIIYPS